MAWSLSALNDSTLKKSLRWGFSPYDRHLTPALHHTNSSASAIVLTIHNMPYLWLPACLPACCSQLLHVTAHTVYEGAHAVQSHVMLLVTTHIVTLAVAADIVLRHLPLEWFSMARGFCCRCFTTSGGMLLKKRLSSASSVRYSWEALSSELNLQHAQDELM